MVCCANSPSANAIQITHPLGVPLVDVQALTINGSSVNMRAFTNINTTANYSVVQNSSYTTLTIYAATATNAGYATSGTGDWYILFFRAGQ